MSESNRESYQTLEWAVTKSETGLFLVIADEEIQEEIVETYRESAVKIFDYRQYPEVYSYQMLAEWMGNYPESGTFFFVNFQFALRGDQDFKRLNFSRDMLARLDKNLFFLTTPYGDDRLVSRACDFYSFIRMRIIFPDHGTGGADLDSSLLKSGLFSPECDRRRISESALRIEKRGADYESTKKRISAYMSILLQKQNEVKEQVGPKHPDMAVVQHELAAVYGNLGHYREAEECCQKALVLRLEIYGKRHPVTARSYEQMADLYALQGKYEEAETTYRRALSIYEETLGKAHSGTAVCCKKLVRLLEKQGRHTEAGKLL